MKSSSSLSAEPPYGECDSPLRRPRGPIDPGDGSDDMKGPDCDQQSTTLPIVYRDRSHGLQMILEHDEHSIHKYLSWELKVPRLNEIHNHLWLAGRPMSARPLHRQAMLGRAIVITEQVDLHMVRQESGVFLKPLPDYLLHHGFWREHICRDVDLYQCASGFLLSYIWLVTSKSDLKMAQEKALLNSAITWAGWQSFTRSLLSSINIETLENVNIRYQYGELRLSRLNWIHRFFSPDRTPTTIIRGYMYGYNQYSDILRRNFAWVLVVFVYLSMVLTAMQVGLTTNRFEKSVVFQEASSAVTAFSIISPLIVMAVIVVNLIGLCIFNVTATLSFKSRTERTRQRLVAGKQHERA